MDENSKIINREDEETLQSDNSVPDKPCKMRCQECKITTITHMKKSYNFYSFLFAFLIFHIYGFLYGIPLMIIIIPLCKNITHECPSCGTTLLLEKFCNIKFQEHRKFIWLQYGNCILIFRVIYVSIIGILVLIFGVYNYTNYLLSEEDIGVLGKNHHHNHSHLIEKYEMINLTWEDLIVNCGSQVMVENSARANEIFNKKFYKKTIEWKGYFLSAYIQAFNPFDFNPEHVLNLNIRMIPSESLKNPDLFLSLDAIRYNKYLTEIRKLKTGDPISFKATFEALGNEWRPHHLHLLTIEKISDFIDPENKVVLFKGIDFDIKGHLKNEKELNEIQLESKIINISNAINENKNETLISNEGKNKTEEIISISNEIVKETNSTFSNITESRNN